VTNNERFLYWSTEKLRRKANQHWEMAGLARQDNDKVDADRHTAIARLYEQEIGRR
jgi:hypothetical protein